MGLVQFKDKLFVLPWSDGYIIYLPLNGVAFLGSQDTLRVLSQLEKGNSIPKSESDRQLIQFLQNIGFFEDESKLLPHFIDPDDEFAPTSVGISTTADCNLGCVYCYSKAGEEKNVVDWAAVKNAIDFVGDNAVKKKMDGFQVGFYGGGEPTYTWQLMVETVEYARSVAQQKELTVFLSTGTNAMLSEQRATWLAQNFNLIQVSWDGPQIIQDAHRPTPNRHGSFEVVFSSIKTIEKYGCPYRLRCTISDYSVSRMVDIIEFVHEHFKPISVQFEPLMATGRGLHSLLRSPEISAFASEFVRAAKKAREYGITLFTTVAQLGSISSHSCGVHTGNFLVTPYGQATLCTEVTNPKQSEANAYIYGDFDKNIGEFIFDLEKVRNWRSTNVNNIPRCANCFCKWSCAGGCSHAIDYGPSLEQREYRCLLTRATTKTLLEEYFNHGQALVQLSTEMTSQECK
jgi:uncharacterized protein